ncbi:MAG: hypothetical protein K1X91_12670 [Bacteriodetes bacterium]|nr:hypothetical protein [Bacteroidota bacterium]
MKQWRNVVVICMCVVALASCGPKKAEPAKVDGLETYSDASTKLSVKYPKNWQATPSVGERFMVISTPGSENRFVEFKEGPAGAKIDVHTVKLKEITLEQYITDDKIFDNNIYSAEEKTTLGGVPATHIKYSFDMEDGKFQGEKWYALRDSMLTTLEFAAFGSTYDAYKSTFNDIMQSFVPATAPEPRKANVVIDTTNAGPEPPSATMMNASGNGYTISIPDNFRGKGVKSGNSMGGTEYLGSRKDCTILIDVLDASKQSKLDKIAADNKAGFGGGNPSMTQLGGVKAAMFSYSPAAGIGRKVYLAVKGDKLYRVFLTWNKAEEATWLAPLEKSVGSLKFN